jgi:hypothetical protein
MITFAALVLTAALAATPASPPAAPVLETPADTQAIELAVPPPPANCWVTCWSTGVTYATWASSMTTCGNFGDLKCGVCNWDGVYRTTAFANC